MKRKSGGSRRGGEADPKIATVDCPSCGCPNKPTDTVCMYCRGELSAGAVSLTRYVKAYANWFSRYLAYWMAGYVGNSIRLFASALMGIILSLAGFATAVKGLDSGSFLWFAVGALMALYGAAMLFNLAKRRGL